LGIKTIGDFCRPLKNMVDKEIATKQVDPEGFFIEK